MSSARLVPHLVTLENKRIEMYIYGLAPQIHGMVAAIEPSTIQRNFAKDCKARPRMVKPPNAKNLTASRGVCFECGGTDHYKSACPRLNRAPEQGGYHPNKAMAIEGGQGYGKNGNPTRGRAFVMGSRGKISAKDETL
ncbi:reverse transcriptase domain-containing protein [Tanacetum coccineum]